MSLCIIITYESNHMCQVMHVLIIIISSSSISDFVAQDDDELISKHIGNGLGTSNRPYRRVLDNVRERNCLETPERRTALQQNSGKCTGLNTTRLTSRSYGHCYTTPTENETVIKFVSYTGSGRKT